MAMEMLPAPQDLLRELIYGINVLFLERSPQIPTGGQVGQHLLHLLHTEGARLGGPAFLRAWEEQEGPTLHPRLRDALDLILEELADQEDPFSAADVFRLLRLEPFWRWRFDPLLDEEEAGLQAHVFQALPDSGQGSVLPLTFRPTIVQAIERAETILSDLHSEQRSPYDVLEEAVVHDCLEEVVAQVRALGHRLRVSDMPAVIQHNAGQSLSLIDALALIQRWKLAPDFDPDPDDGDGEWTLRILERYYRLSWIS